MSTLTRTSDAAARVPLRSASCLLLAAFLCRLTSVSETSFRIIENSGSARAGLTTTVAWTFSAGLSRTGRVVKVTFFGLTFLRSSARLLSLLMLPIWLSTVSALVAAFARLYSLVGLVSVSPEVIFRISEERNCCCTLMRSRSPSLPKLCRVRTNAECLLALDGGLARRGVSDVIPCRRQA